jgi:hypothetical protein
MCNYCVSSSPCPCSYPCKDKILPVGEKCGVCGHEKAELPYIWIDEYGAI